jgi:murein DD-endopeptidase MepM/ murein hydrolase activator NlpD
MTRRQRNTRSGRRLLASAALAVVIVVHPHPVASARAPAELLDRAAIASQRAVRLGGVDDQPGGLVFPLAPTPRCDILDSFGDPRSGGRRHEGVDMLASLGQAVYAAADGVLTTQYVDGRSDSELSGNAWRLTAADGTVFFYAHLSAFGPGLSVGSVVVAGQQIGSVGDTGNPGAGNFHLHFELQRNGTPIESLPLLQIPSGCRVY